MDRKNGRKEGRKEGRKKGRIELYQGKKKGRIPRKEGRKKEAQHTPPIKVEYQWGCVLGGGARQLKLGRGPSLFDFGGAVGKHGMTVVVDQHETPAVVVTVPLRGE